METLEQLEHRYFLLEMQASEFLLNNMGENSEYVLMHQHIDRG
jgi:hypothetical protein